MNTIDIVTRATPNPNALKFMLAQDVKKEGKVTFKKEKPEEYQSIPLARILLELEHVIEVHFFENVITVTQDGLEDWEEIEDNIRSLIQQEMGQHNPDFVTKEAKKNSKDLSPELQKIEEILDRAIRPYLQGDGGDLEVIKFENNVLTVNYEGACGTCPSSIAGTLEGIKGLLRDELGQEIEIVAANAPTIDY